MLSIISKAKNAPEFSFLEDSGVFSGAAAVREPASRNGLVTSIRNMCLGSSCESFTTGNDHLILWTRNVPAWEETGQDEAVRLHWEVGRPRFGLRGFKGSAPAKPEESIAD